MTDELNPQRSMSPTQLKNKTIKYQVHIFAVHTRHRDIALRSDPVSRSTRRHGRVAGAVPTFDQTVCDQ